MNNYKDKLTEQELELSKMVAKGLMSKTNSNPASPKYICDSINKLKDKSVLNEIKLAKIINYLRVNGMPFILKNNIGYYCASNINELQDYAIALGNKIGADKLAYTELVKHIEKTIKNK